jgi:hypothetical protein
MTFPGANMTALKSCLPVAIGLLVLMGCGQPHELAPVHGTVTVDDVPLFQGSVVFTPVARPEGGHPGRVAVGRINADGQFRLRTYDKDDGAIVGEHWAMVINTEEELPDGVPEFARVMAPNKFTVEPDMDNEIDIKFTKAEVRKHREDD